MQWKCLVVLYISYHERRTMVEMEIVYEIGLFPWRKVELKVEIAGYSTMFYCMYPRIVNTVDTVRPLSFWANLSFRW